MRVWLLAILVALTPAFASAHGSDRENKLIIRNHYRLLNAGDFETAALDFAESTAHQGGVRTRAHTLRVLRDIYTTFPDYRMEIVDLVSQGDSVVVRSRVSGTHRGIATINANGGFLTNRTPTGKRFEVDHIHWYKMRGGGG